ncbi:MAG TPA: AAA family ATPase [Rhodothermales bacterium]|nr:AAA family ATPase [Rhodothermales bacterium]
MNATHFTETDLIDFLQNPASYPHGPPSVRLVQTHISLVAIASPYVFKVKKPVDFDFLDFSTLAKRKHFCEQEVALNRRLCARIYEGVVPIWWSEEGFSFEGTGEPVEYAVKMKELAAAGFLGRLLEENAVGADAIDRVVEKLVGFYRSESSTPEIAAWGRVEKLKISTDENFDQTASFVGEALPGVTLKAVQYFTEAFYEREHDLLERRCAEGHLLDCHGDLRAEHIHLSDAGVCIYDCIEFNERFRYIDVASDIAFLAMDLRFHGHPQLSRYLVQQMGDVRGDAVLARLLPFYGCYRAYVRGKVELMRSEEAEVLFADRADSRNEARRYFQLALSYAVGGDGPCVIGIMGRVGSGKTTIAQTLAKVLGWNLVSSDRMRKTLAGVPLRQRGPAAERKRLYASTLTEQTYKALQEHAITNAHAGRSTLIDATYSRRQHREILRETLGREHIPCIFVEATASDKVLRARLAQREHQDDMISDARLEDFEMLTARYEAPESVQDARFFAVSSETEVEETVGAILKAIIDQRLSEPVPATAFPVVV